ncbi:MAG TPA: hypothetical protein VJ647_05855 [Chitinophagaceae bacterium]|nr:hypothetical protein [Chitinophagaceae bacterium]
MNRSFFVALAVVVAATACRQPKKNNTQEQKPGAEIFPVTNFIEGQVHLVDSFQLPTLKYTTINNRTDSSLISLDEFRQLARDFFQPDINDPEISKAYKETSFADQSIKGVTFTYSTDDKDLEIQRVDVVVTPSPVMSDKVRSIYMEKQRVSGDTAVFKKLYWRADKNFQVITTRQVGEQPPFVSVMKVEWDRD